MAKGHGWITDKNGAAQWVGPAECATLEQEPSQWLGHEWIKLIHPEDQLSAGVAWLTALRSRAPFDACFRMRHASGLYLPVRSIGLPIDARTNWSGYAGRIIWL